MTPKPTSTPHLALIALAVLLQAAAPVAVEPSAKFDEKLKAPEAATNEALRASIREYFAVYARATSESPAGIVRDPAAHAKWSETHWRLQRAIDTGRDLGDLTQFGVWPKGDGTYKIDVANFPQWAPISNWALQWLTPTLFDAYAAELLERGFRAEDIDIMRDYASRNEPHRAASAPKIALGESFVVAVKPQLDRQSMIDRPRFMSYLYQNTRIQHEAYRTWTVGLLDSLDPQRQRILESYYLEQNSRTGMTIGPDDTESWRVQHSELISSGEFLRKLEAEKARLENVEVQQ
jgi:hypothetical protein